MANSDKIPGLQALHEEADKLRNGDSGNYERQGRVIAHLADVLIWSIEQGHVSQTECEEYREGLKRKDWVKLALLLAPVYIATTGIAIALFQIIL